MRHVTFDIETYMPPETETAEVQGPLRLVCLSWTDDGVRGHLVDRKGAVELFQDWLADPEVHLVGHNVPFDLLGCLRAVWEEDGVDLTAEVFAAIQAGRVGDTATRQALLAIAGGGIPKSGLGLAQLVKDELGHDIGEDKKCKWSWRYRYAELDGVPLKDWPRRARSYAVDDTLWTRRLWAKQAEVAQECDLAASELLVQNERFQVASALWCALLTARGLRVDYDWACRMADEYASREEEAAHYLRLDHTEDGQPCEPLLRADGTMDTKVKRALFEEAFASIGKQPILTAGGQVSTAQDALDLLVDADADGPRFKWLSLYHQAQKFQSTYLGPILEAGALDLPLHHRLNPLVDSGRTSARAPNMQNLPARAKAKEKGRAITGPLIRGCFVPRPGHVFVAADYTAIEMSGLAQVIFNWTGELGPLAQAINEGKDLHLLVAAQMLHSTYEAVYEAYHWHKGWLKAGSPACTSEDAAERAHHAGRVLFGEQSARARQFAKVVNYGGAGGAGAATIRVQARQQGVEMTEAEARETMRVQRAVFPDLRIYFDRVARCEDRRSGLYICEQHGPGGVTEGWRRRVTNSYTSACNTFFQGIVADGAKAAGWALAKACYADKTSPLYGCGLALFVHDEFILEVPEDRAQEAAAELVRLMEVGMRHFIPNVAVAAEPTIMRTRWSKD